MKIHILVIAILLFGVQTSFAQLELRPFVGFNVSSLDDVGEVDFDAGTGIHFGVNLKIGDRLYFQPGLQYEGTKNDVSGPNIPDNTITINRVRVPVLVGYHIFDTESDELFNIRVFTGPNASFVTDVDKDESQLNIEREDYKDAVFGWNIGAGVDFLFLFLDLSYQFGLSDVFDDLNVMGVEGDNSMNNMFYLSGGIRLNL